MKAARYYEKKDIRIEDVEVPTPGENQIKIAVTYSGICGSDLHEYVGGPIFIPQDNPHPISGVKAPLTMGHEFTGEVVEVGDNVTKHKVGDHVTIEPIIAKDGLVGKYNLDPNLSFVGLGSDGGFAEFAVVNEDQAHTVPDSIDDETAALAEPAAVALYAVRKSTIKAGDTAAVFGCGPIGLLTIESLKAAGAAEIYAIELSESRRNKAEELGAIAVNPEELEDVVEYLVDKTDGGVDVAFEVTGVGPVLQQSIDAVKPDGETVVVSIWEQPAEINVNALVTKEKMVRGTIGYRDVFPAVLKLMEQGYFSKDNYVTKKIKVDDIVEEGFETLVNSKDQIKILVSPK